MSSLVPSYVCCYVKVYPFSFLLFILIFLFHDGSASGVEVSSAWQPEPLFTLSQRESAYRLPLRYVFVFLSCRARARRANKIIIIIVRTQSVPRVMTKIYRPLCPTLALAFRQAESIRPFSEPWLCVPNAAPWLRSA